MRRCFPIFALLPCGLFAQAITELSPLEYRPLPYGGIPPGQLKPKAVELSSKAFRRPRRTVWGLSGRLEIDAVERDPHLPLRGVERAVDPRPAQQARMGYAR